MAHGNFECFHSAQRNYSKRRENPVVHPHSEAGLTIAARLNARDLDATAFDDEAQARESAKHDAAGPSRTVGVRVVSFALLVGVYEVLAAPILQRWELAHQHRVLIALLVGVTGGALSSSIVVALAHEQVRRSGRSAGL